MEVTTNAAPASATTTDTSLARALARNVIIFRARRKLAQIALAEKAGLSRTTVSNVERASVDTTLSVVKRLANALDTTPNELLDEEMPVAYADDDELERLASTARDDAVDAHSLFVATDEAGGHSAERYSRAGRPRVAH